MSLVNLDQPGYAHHIIFKVTVICLSFACVSVALRLWTKLRTGKRTFGVDDGSMLTAFFFYVCLCTIALRMVKFEVRFPVMDGPIADNHLLLLTIGEAIFMTATAFLKISLMIYYRQFVWKKWQRHAIVIAGICSIILSVVAFIVALFQCGGLSHLSSKFVNDQCLPRSAFVSLLYFHGATSALTDWAFALLPIAVLIRSSLAPHIKLGVCVLLTLGVTGSVAACFRTAYVSNIIFESAFLDPAHRPTFYNHSSPEIVLALVELGFGISAASLACLQPLLRHFTHQAKSWFQNHKHLYSSWRSPPNSANVRSHHDLLPAFDHGEKRGVAQLPSSQQQMPQMRAIHQRFLPMVMRRHSLADAGRRKKSVSRKASLGFLPTVNSIKEVEHEDRDAAPTRHCRLRSSIGVLPTLATMDDEKDREVETKRVRHSIGILPTLTTVIGEEKIGRVDSRALVQAPA